MDLRPKKTVQPRIVSMYRCHLHRSRSPHTWSLFRTPLSYTICKIFVDAERKRPCTFHRHKRCIQYQMKLCQIPAAGTQGHTLLSTESIPCAHVQWQTFQRCKRYTRFDCEGMRRQQSIQVRTCRKKCLLCWCLLLFFFLLAHIPRGEVWALLPLGPGNNCSRGTICTRSKCCLLCP